MPNILPQAQRLYQEHTGALPGTPSLVTPQAMQNAGGLLNQLHIKDITPIIGEVSKAYSQRQTELIDAKYLEVETEFQNWQAEYVKASRGSLGLNAARDFTAKHRELSEQAVKDYLKDHSAGDENFGRALAERFDQKNYEALTRGIQFQARQEESYRNNQFAGQLELFNRYVEENPANWEGIQNEARHLVASWQLKNPGLDPTALALKLERDIAKKRIDVLISQERYDEAEAALSTGQIFNRQTGAMFHGEQSQPGTANPRSPGQVAPGATPDSGANPARNPALYKGAQICEDLNNPLNLKKPGAKGGGRESYQVFETPEDGFRGAWQNLRKYKARGITTPRAIITRWAPPNENNTRDYINFVAKQTGLDPDKPIDIDDPNIAGVLIKAMGDREGRLTGKFTAQEITRALNENGGKPRHAKENNPNAASAQGYSQAAANQPGVPQETSGNGAGPGGNPQEDYGMPAHIRALALQRINAARMQKRKAETNGLDEKIQDFIAASKRGEITDMPASQQEVAAAFGEKAPAIWARMEAASRYAFDLKSLPLMRPEEQAALLQSRKPDPHEPDYRVKAEAYDNLSRAIAQDQKLRQEDPALYVITHNEPARRKARTFMEQRTPQAFYDYVAELNAAGEALGQTEADLLPAPVASQLAQELESQDNPAVYLAALEKATGTHWDAVRRQIFKKASPLVNIAASGMEPEAARLLMATRRQPDFRKKAIAATGEDEKDARERIFTQLEDLMTNLNESGAVAQASELQEAALDLALQYRLSGKSMKEACRQAARDVGADRYEFEKSPQGSYYRIPKSRDTEKIFYGALEYLRCLSPDDLYLEDMPKGVDPKAWREDVIARIQTNARFVTDSSESGLYIKVGPVFLRGKNRRPLNPKWDELESVSRGTTPQDLLADYEQAS